MPRASRSAIVLLVATAAACGGTNAAGTVTETVTSSTTAATPPATTATTQPSKQPVAVPLKLRGTVSIDPLAGIGSADQALNRLKWSQVWCGWHGSDVWVHVTWRNPMAENITVHWYSGFHLANAGEHGDSNEVSTHVPARGSAWSVGVDKPEGVVGRPRVTSCIPDVSGVDAGFD